jgi:exopolysaccharide/PEP-CTERM locus tyrosine autokinase
MRKRRGGGSDGSGDGTEPPRDAQTDDREAADSQAASEPVDPVATNLERAMLRFREAAGVDDAEPVPGDEKVPEAGLIGHGAVSSGDTAPEALIAGDGSSSDGAAPSAVDPDETGTGAIAAVRRGVTQAPGGRGAGDGDEIDLELTAEQLRESGLWPAESETRRIEDQYRRIKRPLLANAFGINTERLQDGNLIMVASSLPGEGKSFTSFNLAASIANEMDRTVLLVDADVAKPHITRALGLHERPGLIDLLLKPEMDLQDVILRTSLSGMRVLPSGPIHKHATELLASDRMAALVRELADRYPDRVIVFDTPPLLLTTEAQAMAHLMGQIVVVVHAAHTPQTAVMQALESLEGTTSISLVLNKTRTAWGEEYSRYGYYYY